MTGGVEVDRDQYVRPLVERYISPLKMPCPCRLPLPSAAPCVLKGTASVECVVPDEPVCSCEFHKAMLLRDIVKEIATVPKGILEDWRFAMAFSWCNSYQRHILHGADVSQRLGGMFRKRTWCFAATNFEVHFIAVAKGAVTVIPC